VRSDRRAQDLDSIARPSRAPVEAHDDAVLGAQRLSIDLPQTLAMPVVVYGCPL